MRTHIRRGALLGSALATAAVLTLTGNIATAGGHQEPSHFGFMVEGVDGFTSPSNQELANLAQKMLDGQAAKNDNTDPEMTSGYTYLGQFLDHDLTRDVSPNPRKFRDVTEIENQRTFAFDLDSMYGRGPEKNPELFAADGKHLLVQEPNENGVRDLPRREDGSAVLVEPRNDENQIIAQTAVAFMKFHNRFADSMTYEDARRETLRHYQWMVLKDFLPHFVDQKTIDAVLENRGERLYQPEKGSAPFTPVEFSVAAYRLGHSMVREGYDLNAKTGEIPVFAATGKDLRGGRPIQKGRQIDWGLFLLEFEKKGDAKLVNMSRKMDPLISKPLYVLPIPGAEAEGSNVLAFRNFTRAKFYDLGSGQDVARAMGYEPIPAAKFGDLGEAFKQETPLWYYVLAEAAMTDPEGKELGRGDLLGPVGGRIVAEAFVGALEADRDSILHEPDWEPRPPVATAVADLNIEDMLQYAGVARRPSP